jgi:hypothetical protein
MIRRLEDHRHRDGGPLLRPDRRAHFVAQALQTAGGSRGACRSARARDLHRPPVFLVAEEETTTPRQMDIQQTAIITAASGECRVRARARGRIASRC